MKVSEIILIDDKTNDWGKTKMMKRLLGIMLFVGVMLSSMAFAAVEVKITEVEVDEDFVNPDGETILDVERGDELPVKVRVEVTGNEGETIEDVQIEARLRGFDSSDTIDDITEVFDMKAGRTYVEKLNLPLRQKLDQDKYVLTVSVEGRDGTLASGRYEIDVDTKEHDVEIRDVVLSPSNEVKAGRALLATVRVRNRGEDEEEGVKVTVSVPALGVSASDFIDELEEEGKDDDEATSEELFLRIPDDAATGEYVVRIETVFDQGDKKNVKETSIFVLGKENGEDNGNGAGSDDGKDKTIITVAADGQAAQRDGGEVAYPITLTNAGSSSKTYMVTADGATWANFRVSPSNVMVVESGESKAVTVFVEANGDAPLGSQTFTVTVSTADKVLKQIPLTVNVEEGEDASGAASLKRGLEVGLVVLVILLVIIGLIIGFSKLRGDEDEDEDDDEEDEKTYY